MPATDCLPRATLKRYLVGGTDEQLSGVIEEHLSECESCEQTIVELETEPDTLCEAVRQPTSHSNSAAPQLGPTIADAIAAAQEIMSTSEPMAAPPNVMKRIGSYELLKTLGRGGMGTVMLARHTSLGKQVAVKLLPTFAGDRADLAARFQREVRAAGRLNHPAIVSATDAGYESGMHYLVMEYVTGLDLSRIARLTGPLGIADACEVIRQAALGLAYAHSEGIVHRDIKPSNLMLDANGQVKILDFGLVQLSSWDEAACELTTIGQLMGTLDYMAPEQAERAGSVDHRADIYALGATLFRLLAGRPPLAATPNLSLLEKIKLLAAERPPLVSTLRPDCPDGLVQVIASLLQHDPADRPSSAAHVAEALLPYCEGHDLPKLQSTASSAASVEVASPVRLPSHSTAEVPSRDHALQTTSANPGSAPPTSQFRWWLAAAAAFPLLIAGIVITLEMKKGQLVIQSQVDNVQVRIAQDGKIVDQWTVHPGAQSTRLRADKYEILIEGASDAVAVDKQSVVVRSGETVVATITEQSQATQGPALPTPQPATMTARDPNELVYQDKTLAQWLVKLKVERDRELQSSALKAVETLTTPSSRDMVVSSLTERIAQSRNRDAINACVQSLIDETKWTAVRTGSHQFQLDILQPILKHSTPQQLSELFKSIADGKDRELTEHWVSLFVHFDSTPQSMKEWTAAQIRSEQFAELSKDSAAMVAIAAYTINRRDAEWRTQNLDQLFQAMSRHPDFGALWVLESSPLALSSKIVPSELQPDQIAREEAVGRFAMNVIRNPQSSSAELTFAACRLATTSEWIDEEKNDDLVEHLKQRLTRIAGRPEELLLLHLQSKRKVHPLHYVTLVRPDVARIDSVNDNWTSLNRLSLIPSEPLAVITLLLRLGKAAEAEHELFAIWKTCMLSWKKIENDATGLQEPTYGILGTNWDFPGRTNPLSSDQRLRDDWLKWFVGMQMLTSLRGIHSDVRPFPITNEMIYRFVELDENNDGYVAISDLDV
ncbi:MAG: serine/threonine-protein kinase [Pirellulales bacterium]